MYDIAFENLKSNIPLEGHDTFFLKLKERCTAKTVEKYEVLINYQEKKDNLYFIVSGSFFRKIITSRGEEKTVMFHTEDFHEYMKAYDTAFSNNHTIYEIVANERSVVIVMDYIFVHEQVINNLVLLRYYTQKTEELFSTIDAFRNFQLGLTSDQRFYNAMYYINLLF